MNGSIKVNNEIREQEIPDAIELEAIAWAKEDMRQQGYKPIFEAFLKIGYEAGVRATQEKYRKYAEGEIDNL